MRRLDLYILREIAVPFVVGMGLFFVVVVFAQLLEVSERTVRGDWRLARAWLLREMDAG